MTTEATPMLREEPTKVLGVPIQTLIAIVPLVIGSVGGYFVLRTEVGYITEAVEILTNDHDTLVRMEGTLANLTATLVENRANLTAEIAKLTAAQNASLTAVTAKLAEHEKEISRLKQEQETRFLRLEFTIDEMFKRMDRALTRAGEKPEGR